MLPIPTCSNAGHCRLVHTSTNKAPSSIHYASPIESFSPPSSSRQNSSEPATKHAFTALLLSAFRAPLLVFTCNLHGVLQTRVLLRIPATSSPSGEGCWVTKDIFSSFCRSGLILLDATSFDSPLSLFCGALSVSAHGCGVVGFSLGGAGRRIVRFMQVGEGVEWWNERGRGWVWEGTEWRCIVQCGDQ